MKCTKLLRKSTLNRFGFFLYHNDNEGSKQANNKQYSNIGLTNNDAIEDSRRFASCAHGAAAN